MQLKWPMLWDFFSLFPAYAGVILTNGISFRFRKSLPRIRGGDPVDKVSGLGVIHSSPHTRG